LILILQKKKEKTALIRIQMERHCGLINSHLLEKREAATEEILKILNKVSMTV
jgi:hypothetical protein